MKYGFLFGAGAELSYNLPSGGKFALDIFRQNQLVPKEKFNQMRANVEPTTTYASNWLPEDYITKQVRVFGKSVLQNIIMSTIEHRRMQIIDIYKRFDALATRVYSKMNKEDQNNFNKAISSLLKRDVKNFHLTHCISYIDVFKEGNDLFSSCYFSALLLSYKELSNTTNKSILKKILISIMQLQLGALSEELSCNINNNLFTKKDDQMDLFDDFGDLFKIDYNSAGVSGLELLLDDIHIDISLDYGIVPQFAKLILEEIYSSVLDYKSLIDMNWHYLYNPRSDWAKFSKMVIFLLTVYEYISELGKNANINNPNGYYNVLSNAISSSKFEVSSIATTNYNRIISDILGEFCSIVFLNGSVETWYDPYLNKIGKISDLDDNEHHILVPLLFTQSGTKPMTSISMSSQYVRMYEEWKRSDAIVVVGFGFGEDDEHINGILRTLVNDDKKTLVVVTLGNKDSDEESLKSQIGNKLKISNEALIKTIFVDENGKENGKLWTDALTEIVL